MTPASPPEDYPPRRHVLRDLGIWIDTSGDAARAGLEVGPQLLAPAGGVRAGVLATLVDVVAGGFAIQAVAPDWAATSDLVLHRMRAAAEGEIVAEPRLARSGRSTVVLEVEVRAAGEALALATVGFSRLASRGGIQRAERGPGARTAFALEDSGLASPLAEALGVRLVDPAAGRLELPVAPYVGNSLGAIQGGVVATLVDLAAEAAAGAALGQPAACDDLAIHFVGLGRVGPIRSAARLLRLDPDGTLLRVELRDSGAGDRLCTLATATARA